jgi:inner membrane protein
MATVVTHAFLGAALAQAGPHPVLRRRLVLALVVLSVLPDLDILAFAVGIPYEHDLGHRGLSHSILFAMLAAWAVARFGFPAVPRYSRAWWQLFGILALAAASHGLLDALTNGGLGVGFWVPFSSERFFFPFRPLEVSPIGLKAIWEGPMSRVMISEILYVWLPVGCFLCVAAVRHRFRRS